jgi:hypothetical protein
MFGETSVSIFNDQGSKLNMVAPGVPTEPRPNVVYYFFPLSLFFLHRRWKQHVAQKRCHLSTELHAVTS